MKLTIEYLQNTDKDIILFGAGKTGEIIIDICVKNNININCFCDNDTGKIGKSFKNNSNSELKIYNISDISVDTTKIFIITSPRKIAYEEIKKQIKKHGNHEIYLGIEFFEIVNYISDDVIENDIINAYRYEKYKTSNSDILYIEKLQLQITDKCSLRCKDCSNMMQYYENPKNYSYKSLIDEINKLTNTFDYINQISLLGGETFMHKDIFKIIQYLCTKENIHNIRILTNGTICPNEKDIQQLDKTKVSFQISNYGIHSKNIDKLCNMLERNKISYRKFELYSWYKYECLPYQNLNVDQLEYMFSHCVAQDFCSFMLHGKIFRCPRAANMYNLEVIPNEKSDFIDLMSIESVDDIKIKLNKFLYDKKYINECQYCSGGDWVNLPDIPVAEQTDHILEYKKYD